MKIENLENLDLLHFEQLKTEIQQKFLENHTPSYDEISKWKGIDIIYFQEDLRKNAKGNISEKSFYSYFKSKNNQKLPRIDMLNILSIYAGYQSWYDFKKHHLSANELLNSDDNEIRIEKIESPEEKVILEDEPITYQEKIITQNNDNEIFVEKSKLNEVSNTETTSSFLTIKKWWAYAAVIAILLSLSLVIFWKSLFATTYRFTFRDADRSGAVNVPINVKVIKENETPLYYRIAPGKDFIYSTKERALRMEITSPLYENMQVTRNLENAPFEEEIILKPNDYKSAVYYYSKKDIASNAEDALEQIKLKRRELDRRISDQAVISQVFDNNIYGIETLDKEKYITLVTTPTTSLKNLSFIDIKSEKGKIVSIKFKIKDNE